MAKNDMSLFKQECSTRYYLLHPWKWFRDLYWSCRNFIHRGKYGFAYIDVWCMDAYLLKLIPLMLRYLKDHGCGYPGTEPFETPEKYKEWLTQLAEKFENCISDFDEFDKRNEYAEAFIKQGDTIRKRMLEEGRFGEDVVESMTMEEKIVRNKYFDRITSLQNENDKNILEAYTELAKNHNILWD